MYRDIFIHARENSYRKERLTRLCLLESESAEVLMVVLRFWVIVVQLNAFSRKLW